MEPDVVEQCWQELFSQLKAKEPKLSAGAEAATHSTFLLGAAAGLSAAIAAEIGIGLMHGITAGDRMRSERLQQLLTEVQRKLTEMQGKQGN